MKMEKDFINCCRIIEVARVLKISMDELMVIIITDGTPIIKDGGEIYIPEENFRALVAEFTEDAQRKAGRERGKQ